MNTAKADDNIATARREAIEILKREGWSPRQINRVISSGKVYSPAPLPTQAEPVEIEAIIAALVVELNKLDWDVDFKGIVGKETTRAVAAPRGAAMWLAREILGDRASFPAIGRVFNRDHSTVMHAVHISKWREIDDDRITKAVAAVLKKHGKTTRKRS